MIKLFNSGVVGPSHLTVAARLIAKQSSIKAGEIDIIFTQLKNVRGVTGTPGMVTYKKEKRLLCDLMNEE